MKIDAIRGCGFIAATLAVAVLGGCSSDKPPSGQVVAVVDGQELTSAQLWLMLQSTDPQNARDPQTRKAVMNGLIDETLFMKEAEREKIDQEPSVAREIERARRAVLAQAYLSRIIPKTSISDGDVADFYRKNPAVFANRRQYGVIDLAVRGGADLDQYVAPLGETISLDQLAQKLKAEGRTGQMQRLAFSADQIDPSMAAQLANMSAGAHYSYATPGIRHFVQIVEAVPAPVALPAATSAIKGYLQRDRAEKAARERIAALRAKRTVVLGEAGLKIESAAKAAPTALPQSAPVTRSPNANGAKSDEAITRGLNGL
jgi:peptidyl-prolyl cis-trans isomerase C